MELAFVLLFVLLGTGAILYAGLHTKAPKPSAPAEAEVDEGAPGEAGAESIPEAAPIRRDLNGVGHVDRTD